ncbi:MAG: hypothetical protein KF726_21845, partial [Anaerolineae bacterium]|nr:hypothetical protein [Anaerolineae bacterium]
SNPFELTASGRAVRDWNVGITRGVLRWLEPFYCWRENANLGHSRLRHPESLIDQLWKQILADQADTALHEPQNQARREERERYYRHRVDELCDVSLHALTENVDTAALPVQGMTALLVFNSGSARVRGTFRFQIGWARSEPEQDKLYALYVYDQEGKLVGGAIPTEQTEFVQELLFSVDVPAFGYSSYSVALEPIRAEFTLPVEIKRGDLRGYVTAFHKGSLPVSTAMLTVSDWRFEITAIKLPEDGRRGVIVRGSNRDEQPLMPTIKLWRPFKFCEAVRMDEALTAAKMNMDAEGAFKFKATPHRILTFWLHD